MRGEEVRPDKPIVRRYLGDANYPADLRELISEAEGNGAPASLVERLKNLPTDVEFSDLSEVAEALERQDESYEGQARSRPEAASKAQQDGAAAAHAWPMGAGPDALAGGESRQVVAGGFP